MPRDQIRSTLVLAAGCLLASHGALLQAQSADDTGPATITRGPFSILPLLSAEVAYDDNIFESASNEVDSWVTYVKPSVSTALETGGQLYALSYSGDYGRYLDSSDDDYEDHNFNAGADLNLGLRHHVQLSANYAMDHEERGKDSSEGFDPDNPSIDAPLQVDKTLYDGEYAYGSRGSIGRIVLAANYLDVAYQNERASTRYRDYDSTGASATFYYRVLPATSLLFEVRASKNAYALDRPGSASLDSQTRHYLFGATWDITELTNGTLKLGHVQREFDDQARGDFSGFDWELDMRWSPRSYSHVDIIAAREEEEAYGDGNFIDVRRYEIHWNHDWTDRIGTKIDASYVDETFIGDDRDEQSMGYGIAVKYRWQRWLSLQLGANFSDRDSNLERLQYDRTLYKLSVNLSL